MNGLQFLALVLACAYLFHYATKKEKTMTTHKELQDAMEFDHVIEVHKDGSITDAPGEYAPDYLDNELSGEGWETMTDGYTGQFGYNGPVMHDSEFIGGRLADDILSEPGYYVCIGAYYTPEDSDIDPESESDSELEGWVICFKPSPESN